VGVYANEEVVKKLGLSDAQKEDLKKINDDFRTEMGKLFQPGGGGGAGGREKMATLTKETKEKASKVLTDAQRKTMDEMLGKPFEVQFAPRPPQQ
jgi:hypothetical protein